MPFIEARMIRFGVDPIETKNLTRWLTKDPVASRLDYINSAGGA
jgi:hypothetical protein